MSALLEHDRDALLDELALIFVEKALDALLADADVDADVEDVAGASAGPHVNFGN